ncbi:MAG: hypothetical protein LBF88_01985 [Planctomycetaceae bacterium]|nr:hypothetical protein [Planctomycetaceae bacterium]
MPITYHKPKHVPGKDDYGFYEFSEHSIGLTIVTKDIKILSSKNDSSFCGQCRL